MSKTYHYKKGTMQMGPYPLEKMRALARQGQVGRSHQISGDGGASWDTGTAYPEIFAAGDQPAAQLGPQPSDSTNVQEPQRTTSGVPIEPSWHYCTAGGGQQGPVPESQLRQLIEFGRIGPSDTVWTESIGDQWVAARSVPRLSGLFSQGESERGAEDERDVVRSSGRKSRRSTRSATQGDQRTSAAQSGFNGAGLSGFICSMVAIVLLAIPCLVWVVVAESFFWIFNIVIPFTILAVVGLVLSVIGLTKTPRGMATTGTVLGVIALMLGVMALVGWFMLPYRLAMQRRTAIDSFATDIKLEQKNLSEALAAYRKVVQEKGESDVAFAARAENGRRLVGMQLDTLVKAYDGHVSATAKTSEFRDAFMELATLRKTIEEVKQAAQAVEGVEVIDVLQVSNADARSIKVLMDTLRLLERGEITLKQAEAKMTGR
jgi:hypothetical protein